MAIALAFQVSVAGAFEWTNPGIALKVAPFDAEARATLAARLVPSDDSKSLARALALDGIRRSPMQPRALAVLAQSLPPDDTRQAPWATELMLESEALSRREPVTETWLANHYGKANSPELLIKHFDILLRSSETARDAAFPLLVDAASEPAARAIVLRTLATRPNWAGPFAGYVLTQGGDLSFAAAVGQQLLDPKKPDEQALLKTLMQRLVAAGEYAQAWDIYRLPGLSPPGAANKTIRNGGFELAEDGSPFDWTYAQEPELSAFRDWRAGTSKSVMRISAYNGRSGEVAHTFIKLGPGKHRLRMQFGDIPADPYDRPELRIECVNSDTALAALKPASNNPSDSFLETTFEVPANCTFQRATVRAAGQGEAYSPLPWIDEISID